MANHPLTGTRITQDTDAPLFGSMLAKAVIDLSPQMNPAFDTVAARNAAYQAWATGGVTMRDGLTCSVAGRQQIYRANSWRGVATESFVTNAADSAQYLVSQPVMSISLPYYGYPYRVVGQASVGIRVAPGVTVAMRYRVNGADIPVVGEDVTNPGQASINAVIISGMSTSDVFTNAVTVQGVVWKTGLAEGGYEASATSLYTQLTALVVPA